VLRKLKARRIDPEEVRVEREREREREIVKNGRPEREREKGATCTAGTAAGEATGERAGEGADGMEGEAGESHEKLSEEGTAVTVKIKWGVR
jgi:hypothetical protein